MAAGKQAEVLNQVVNELLEGHPLSDVQLKEVLGHTPLQVRHWQQQALGVVGNCRECVPCIKCGQ
jgi:acid phosphatase family membrane protein YuiD